MRFSLAECGYETTILDIDHVPLDEDYLFLIHDGCGKAFSSGKDGLVLSLPLLQPSNTLTLFNTGLDERCQLSIKPYNGNGIMYRGHGKSYSNLVNTRATQRSG